MDAEKGNTIQGRCFIWLIATGEFNVQLKTIMYIKYVSIIECVTYLR